MSSFFSFGDGNDNETDNPNNPGNNPNFDAGVPTPENDAEAAAFADYDMQVGSDEHQQAVADARESAGIEDSPASEEWPLHYRRLGRLCCLSRFFLDKHENYSHTHLKSL